MTCPFCKQPISEQTSPFAHMVLCQQEETKLWEGRFKLVVERLKEESHEPVQS